MQATIQRHFDRTSTLQCRIFYSISDIARQSQIAAKKVGRAQSVGETDTLHSIERHNSVVWTPTDRTSLIIARSDRYCNRVGIAHQWRSRYRIDHLDRCLFALVQGVRRAPTVRITFKRIIAKSATLCFALHTRRHFDNRLRSIIRNIATTQNRYLALAGNKCNEPILCR